MMNYIKSSIVVLLRMRQGSCHTEEVVLLYVSTRWREQQALRPKLDDYKLLSVMHHKLTFPGCNNYCTRAIEDHFRYKIPNIN